MERPTATVRNVSIQQAGLTGIHGELAVDVMNPNAFSVPLSGIDWQLTVGGAPAVGGQITLNQTIPAEGVSPITTSLQLDLISAGMVMKQLAQGAHTYVLTAKLHFSTAVGKLDVDVTQNGDL
ncbi:MAG: LEA type 2 family protein [Kofleriaceae bacterium]